ncbi:MAG: Cytochrome oxidase, cbb3-type, subunit [Alphaproteobacteria bacterium]|jgi:mono/diheme cytochrome c family protein|nr:Cytochrome oxidase, cbb3-type, subunit [Alphaproteobacteria bacterium]
MMRRGWIALCFLAAVPQVALAEDHVLTEQQKLGWRLYETSCGICHTRPTLIAGLYGPELNKETAGGREDLVQGIITDGTPRMPGFKYTYNPEQIAAIAAYVKTLPVGNQAPTVPPAARSPAPAQ